MVIPKLWENKIIEYLSEESIFKREFIPKYKKFPRLCKKFNIGQWKVKPLNITGGAIKFTRLSELPKLSMPKLPIQ